MEDLTDILNDDSSFTDEELKKYLKGTASPEERHALEKKMVNSTFLEDAVEGLQQVRGQNLDEYVKKLNNQLRGYIAGKKQIKEQRKLKELSWIIIAVVIVLLLCFLGYIVISME
jgi:hypothetical protein